MWRNSLNDRQVKKEGVQMLAELYSGFVTNVVLVKKYGMSW